MLGRSHLLSPKEPRVKRLTMTSSGLVLGSTESEFFDDLPRGDSRVRCQKGHLIGYTATLPG